MKDLSIYFKEVSLQHLSLENESIGTAIIQHHNQQFPTIKKGAIALFDIPEYRNNKIYNTATHTSSFREEFYVLYQGINWETPLYDLGTIAPGETLEDTFYALKEVCKELIKQDVIPIIIGGSQELTKALYEAYKELELLVNLTTIDRKLDLGTIDEKVNSEGWLSHILMQEPCYLFNYSNIGGQIHYMSKSSLDLLNNLYFDFCRLGTVDENIELTEPFIRNSDLISIDLTAIRGSEYRNSYYSSPNGLFADQICRIARYAGISDKLTSLGIFNYYTGENNISSQIVAQIIWYFIEGHSHRKGDFPIGAKKDYRKFKVFLEDLNEEIVFYKSNKSARWWMEVPFPDQKGSKFLRHQMIPCSFKTYQEAMEGEIPNLWWKTYQKLA